METQPEVAPPRKFASDFGLPCLSGGGDIAGDAHDRTNAFRLVTRLVKKQFYGDEKTAAGLLILRSRTFLR